MGCVYVLTFCNGKQYVGMTLHAAKHRLSEHLANARSGDFEALYCALRKHGEPRMSILEESDDKCLLQLLEMDYIALLQSKSPSGYNLTDGGECLAGYRHTAAQRSANSERGKRQFASVESRTASGLKVKAGLAKVKPLLSKTSKAVWERPGYREAQRERWRLLWQDPAFKAARLAKQRAGGFFTRREL